MSDIVIAGAGPVGLALALALQTGDRSLTLVDARAPGAAENDPRTLALSWGSRLTLQRLGVWDDLPVTPIETIHISQRGGFGRTLIRAEDEQVEALGYVVTAGALAAALGARIGSQVRRLHYTEVRALPASASGQGPLALQLLSQDGSADKEPLATRLLACAEGGLDAADPAVLEHDYQQTALIGFVDPAQPHQRIAYERFTHEGPIALLPCQKRYALVHVVPPARAQALAQQDAPDYLRTLQAALGRRVMLSAVGERLSYPLKLRYRRNPVGARCVWLGNAAQTLHPVAGQGFNLALRDVWSLAEQLQTAGDPGESARLHAYQRRRQLDRRSTIAFTDGVVKLFSNELAPLRHLRGAGLCALDLVPPLRHFVARRMMFGARAWP